MVTKQHHRQAGHHAGHAGGAAAPDNQGNTTHIGELFGLPGITRPTEQVELIDGTVTNLSQTNQVGAIFANSFAQTDVMLGWDLEFIVSQTVVPGTQTVTASQYFPYGIVSSLKLNMQNQFDTVNIAENGIDAAIFQMIRPRYPQQMQNVLQQNTIASAYSASPNLDTATNYTSASGTLQFTLQLAPGLQLDHYWECDDKGKPRHKQPLRDVFVSPQLMSGTNRIVQPKVKYNPFFGSTTDAGLYTVSGTPTTPATATGSVTLGVTRYGYYQPVGPHDTPLQFDWQYTREATRFGIGAQSKLTIPMPLAGQILSVFVRLYDPAANAGVGAPIALSSVRFCRLLYGSGQLRFDDNPQRMQRRFVEQRQILLPAGVIAWDLAYNYGYISNRYALNTMDTTNIGIYLEFTGVQSAQSYAVVGVEALRYVARM